MRRWCRWGFASEAGKEIFRLLDCEEDVELMEMEMEKRGQGRRLLLFPL